MALQEDDEAETALQEDDKLGSELENADTGENGECSMMQGVMMHIETNKVEMPSPKLTNMEFTMMITHPAPQNSPSKKLVLDPELMEKGGMPSLEHLALSPTPSIIHSSIPAMATTPTNPTFPTLLPVPTHNHSHSLSPLGDTGDIQVFLCHFKRGSWLKVKEQLSAVGVKLREAIDITGTLQYKYWMACANTKMILDQEWDFTQAWEGMVRVTHELVSNGANIGHVASCTITILNNIEGVPNEEYKYWEEQLPNK